MRRCDYVVTLGATTDLTNKTITILATDGFEDSKLTSPVRAVRNAGTTVHVVPTEDGSTEGKNDTKVDVDRLVNSISAGDYDALVPPGGTASADQIRIDKDAVTLVKGLIVANKPIGVTYHGGWTPTNADILKGRTITPYISAKTDLVNAGTNWADEGVIVDNNLISSRTPTDLRTFNKALVEDF